MNDLLEQFMLTVKRTAYGPEKGVSHEAVQCRPDKIYYTGILVPGTSASHILKNEDMSDNIDNNPDTEAIDSEDPGNSDTVTGKAEDYNISSAGIIFSVNNDAIINVLVSYGRYEKSKDRYVREPLYKELSIDLTRYKEPYCVDIDGDDSIDVKLEIEYLNEKNLRLTLFNEEKRDIPIDDIWKYKLFQVSLRINVEGGPLNSIDNKPFNSEINALYWNKVHYARGYNCSSIWNHLDTELKRDSEGEKKLKWCDYTVNYDKYYAPDLRIEFMPVYQSLTPESVKSDGDLSPSSMVSSLDMQKLNNLAESYEKWINGMSKKLEDKIKNENNMDAYEILSKNIDNNRTALKRIRDGINILNNNGNAEKSFRFVNAVMSTVGRWRKYRGGFVWRPFQMAFLLMEIDGIVNETSETRNIVDVLWVHTGAGKTEAYLAAAIFDIIYRRYKMKSENKISENPGTSVISRYTLRLLTVQQFKRTVDFITAAEYIRQKGYNGISFNDQSEYPISAGLWVGNNLTPNSRNDAFKFFKSVDSTGNHNFQGNPAQIIKCPACWSLLAIPQRESLKTGDSFFILSSGARQLNSGGKDFSISSCGDEIFKITALRNMTFIQVKNSADFSPLNIKNISGILFPGYHINKINTKKEIEIKCNNPDCELHRNNIRIPAYTVDDDIYTANPSFIISTVDKIARLAFNENASKIFGNMESHRPDLMIQDEMHLLTGPMGSFFGVYENSVSAILRHNGVESVKYIAASATVNRYSEQIQSLFSRNGMIFPPGGASLDDSYFFHAAEQENDTGQKIIPDRPGRTYVGIMPAGTSVQSALVDILSRIINKKYENIEDENIKYFWTPVIYFNSIKELSIAGSLYREDVMQRVSLSGISALNPENIEELSGRAISTDIPVILDRLENWNPRTEENSDALITTSMFGTGVDISRFSLMIVGGQPKMTAEYIQATGRTGREKNALVIVIYSASRPRDRSHYEMFLQYHDKIHANVESSPVSPWSIGSLDIAAAPAFVAFARAVCSSMTKNEDAINIRNNKKIIEDFFDDTRERLKYLDNEKIIDGILAHYRKIIDRWEKIAENSQSLVYSAFSNGDKNSNSSIVLGSPEDRYRKKPENIVYENVPQSLRDIEESANFGGADIRKSQFIFGYGPGSIIEGKDHASVIKRKDIYNIQRPDKSKILKNSDISGKINSSVLNYAGQLMDVSNLHVIDLPSNQAINYPSDKELYKTAYFPLWRVCYNESAHEKNTRCGEKTSILYKSDEYNNKCPVCGTSNNSSQIRFIMACPSGHLDDVNWNYAVHSKFRGKSCESNYYHWSASASSLSSIKIKCAQCGENTNMQEIYRKRFKCTGRHMEDDSNSTCTCNMKIIQRQSSSVRYPLTSTFLNMPGSETLNSINSDKLKEVNALFAISVNKDNLNSLNEGIRSLLGDSYGNIRSAYELNTVDGMNRFKSAINEIITPDLDIKSLMAHEFQYLRSTVQDPESFGNFEWAIPRDGIDMITLQLGYVRNIRLTAGGECKQKIVRSSFNFDKMEYMPGIINTADSIFIYAENIINDMKKYRAENYTDDWTNIDNKYTHVWKDYTKSPEFVFLHTLSHALIKAISHRTGYSISSIRERVYATDSGNGILIYSSIPGSDGNVGGLSELVTEEFVPDIFSEALKYIDNCSNDPFCRSTQRGNGPDGAACYSCIMLPETSCEYGNSFLDRKIWRHIQ